MRTSAGWKQQKSQHQSHATQQKTRNEWKNLPDTKSKWTRSQRAWGSLSPGDSRTYRRVQMLHLRLHKLFPSSSPPQDFSLTFIQKTRWEEGELGSAQEQVSETKEVWENWGWEAQVSPSETSLASAPRRASTAAEQRTRGERGEEERQAEQSRHSLLLLLLLLLTAWQEQNPGTGFWIQELRFPEQKLQDDRSKTWRQQRTDWSTKHLLTYVFLLFWEGFYTASSF